MRPFASRWNRSVSTQKNKNVMKCRWTLYQLQNIDGKDDWVLLAGFNDRRKAFDEAPKRHGRVMLVGEGNERLYDDGVLKGTRPIAG